MPKCIIISDLAHEKIVKAQARIQMKTGRKPTLPKTLDVLLKVPSKNPIKPIKGTIHV